MSEKGEDSAEDQSLEAIRAEAKSTLSEIKKFRAQVEDQFKAAEVSRKGADEHASYANQAKINTEEHSKATAVFKGTAEADSNSIATNKQKSDELLAALTREKADIDADAKVIAERRKEVEKAATGIKDAAEKGSSRLQEIETLKSSSNTLLSEIEGSRDAAINASALSQVFLLLVLKALLTRQTQQLLAFSLAFPSSYRPHDAYDTRRDKNSTPKGELAD
jgi:hypothetical protein